jgi:hypothetical protein
MEQVVLYNSSSDCDEKEKLSLPQVKTSSDVYGKCIWMITLSSSKKMKR